MWYLQFHFECVKIFVSVILTIPPCFLVLVGGPTLLLYHKEEYLYLKIFNSTTSSGGLFSLKATIKKNSACLPSSFLQSKIKIDHTPEYAEKPPSMGSTTPVMKLAASSERRKRSPPSSSLDSPNRFIGVPPRILSVLGVGEPSGLNNSALF